MVVWISIETKRKRTDKKKKYIKGRSNRRSNKKNHVLSNSWQKKRQKSIEKKEQKKTNEFQMAFLYIFYVGSCSFNNFSFDTLKTWRFVHRWKKWECARGCLSFFQSVRESRRRQVSIDSFSCKIFFFLFHEALRYSIVRINKRISNGGIFSYFAVSFLPAFLLFFLSVTLSIILWATYVFVVIVWAHKTLDL